MARDGEKMSKFSVDEYLEQNLSRLWAQIIIASLIKKGIYHYYLSPGMRNAPLIAALRHLAQFCPEVTIETGWDERAHSFRALGSVRISERPAVLICTSGSALGHYMPAVIEAHKSGLPLLILSSDRPLDLALSNANQTIKQPGLYAQFVRESFSLPTPNENESPAFLSSIVSESVDRSLAPHRGPVHLNIPFKEPLGNENDEDQWSSLERRSAYINEVKAIINQTAIIEIRSHLLSPVLKDQLPSLKMPVLLVVGELTLESERVAVREFLKKRANLPVMIDVASGLKFEWSLKEKSIPTFDHPEVLKAYEGQSPQTVIHLGGRTTSKHYYRLLRQWSNVQWWVFEDTELLHDPAHARTMRVRAPLSLSLPELHRCLPDQVEGLNIDFDDFVQRKSQMIDGAPLANPSLSKMTIEHTPTDTPLFLGNSTIIRSFDSYASVEFKTKLPVYVQRGASGIEGLLSTAIGLCDRQRAPLVAVLGDISLLHDLNALVTLAQTRKPIVLVVINNGGGGIFNLLAPGRDPLINEDLFTPHQVDFKKVANALELTCHQVDDPQEYKKILISSLEQAKNKGPQIIEAIIDDKINQAIYGELKTIKL
jgi:2-succinyl-5-enolpyruvyl-6-hydroxy-3-cyclohexene-1-carboxylate synthase